MSVTRYLLTLLSLSHCFGTTFAVCPHASTPAQKNLGGCDYHQIAVKDFQTCQQACCADKMCSSWNFDSNLTAAQRPPACKASGGPLGCCWLKGCPGNPGKTCGSQPPDCVSWSGTSGRRPPSPPVPPPPPPCPTGEICFYNEGTRPGVTKSFDCAMRTHAWEFAKATLPSRDQFRTAFEALQLQACGLTPPAKYDMYKPPSFETPNVDINIYVDGNSTVAGDGTKEKPFATLEQAVAAAGQQNRGSKKTILMKAGVYRTAGIVLTTEHNGLTIQNFNGENVVVSGAVPVENHQEKWTLHNKETNTWKLDMEGQGITEEFGMRVGTQRAVRAKFPNGNPETAPSFCIIPLGSIASPGVYLNGSGVSENYPSYFPRLHEPINMTNEYWAYPSDWPGTYWHNKETQPSSIGGYGPYFYASGGVCSGRTPAHGYWCSANCPRGVLGQHNIDPPGGFVYYDVLPQAVNYSKPQGAIFHARGGSMPYFSYMCVVKNISEGNVYFREDVGCDQGGPTPSQPGKAWDWFIENVKEECDFPGEYYYDVEEEALYYTFNHTEAPTGMEEFALTQTKVIFNISGTKTNPVRDITIRGLTIRDAAFTYLGTTEADIHWLPSEGDWALQRSGAITIEGAEDITIDQNQLTRVDGNGIFLGGYTRGVNITRNDLNWIGDSAMAAFGWTTECLNANCSIKLPAKVGPDGRGGEQPRNTLVAGNLVREIGIWQKQSSAWFQALAATTTLQSNVFFNGPRAAINFNDAFGGGNQVIGNLIFNQVRETVDHGTLNAWERGPYISDIGYVEDPDSNLTPSSNELAAGATPGFKLDKSVNGSVVGQYTTLAHNFLLGNYNVNSNLETDDGSSRYLMYRNYFVYATSATDYAMNSRWNYQVDNVYAYGETILRGWEPGQYDPAATHCYVYNSTFYMLGDGMLCGGHFQNATLATSVIHTNRTKPLSECANAVDGSVNLMPPASDAEVTQKAKEVLGDYPKPF
eukprot:m.59603 g.59603  ORF g.59603 m.59603 type:complete len:982 (-) comp11259_c0_seq3:95-3040(-)